MRFIRKGGRVIPIRESGVPVSAKKKYPTIQGGHVGKGILAGVQTGIAVAAAHSFGVGGMHTWASFGKKLGKGAAIGAVVGAAIGSIKITNKAKGESHKHLANRIKNYSNSKRFKTNV